MKRQPWGPARSWHNLHGSKAMKRWPWLRSGVEAVRWSWGVVASRRGGAAAAARQQAAFALESLEARDYLAATVITPLPALSVAPNAADTVVNLNTYLNDPAISGTVVQFNTSLGLMNVELFDAATPKTVTNFLNNYVNTGAYNNTFFHRSAASDPTADVANFQQIMDNTDATGVTIVGSWQTLTDGVNLVGPDPGPKNYLSDGNAGKGTKSITFTPTLPRTGHYNVYARWTAGADRATNTAVTIQSATGTLTGTINQQLNDRAWALLNNAQNPIAFSVGNSGSITISNTGSNGTVTIDAVAFVIVDQGFVIQGGGFKLTSASDTPVKADYVAIPSAAAVQNEPGISNVRGTIAMAKTSLPNSATNQFFFNVNDNTFLNDASRPENTGGFTVFGRALGATSLRTMDVIAGLPTVNFSDLNSAFNDLPLIAYNTSVTHYPKQTELVRILSVSTINKVTYTVTGDNNALVTPTVANNQLRLKYAANGWGAAKVTVRATSADGSSVTSTFDVSVTAPAAVAELFQESYYRRIYPDVAAGVQSGVLKSGLQHWWLYGQKEGRIPSPYWDEAYYRAKNPDVAAAIANNQLSSGFAHFAQWGQREGRAFLPWFSEKLYLALHADVAAGVTSGAVRSGYAHWVRNGLKEMREFSPTYSEKVYLDFNPDIKAAVQNGVILSGLEHFLRTGQKEGRRFSALFNEAFYLARHADVAAAVQAGTRVSGWDHFNRAGMAEGRVFSPWYSESFYLAQNPDVAAGVGPTRSFRNGLEHFFAFGQREGRKFSKLFDESVYRAANPAVATQVQSGVYRSGFEHYVLVGMNLGRLAYALYDETLYRARNSDVDAAVVGGLIPNGQAHFNQYGRLELGRVYSLYFNELYYRQQHPEVVGLIATNAFRSALEHFTLVGQWQGWLGVPPV